MFKSMFRAQSYWVMLAAGPNAIGPYWSVEPNTVGSSWEVDPTGSAERTNAIGSGFATRPKSIVIFLKYFF
jgi:hypothetical protein